MTKQGKPVIEIVKHYGGEIAFDEWFEWACCPECNGDVAVGYDKYCQRCGARLVKQDERKED